ncbi:TPA: hypothetical protein N3A40_001923 [Salmonella enterica subsp. salamae serovar 30:m,t:-]|nr:hypothetical protein [Salmonella enterica subsp. salamae serovar 30:m,t:-]
MPSGLTSTGLSIVQQARDAGLNFVVNGMAMDYYDPQAAQNMGKAAIDAATSICHQLERMSIQGGFAKVAVTPMIPRSPRLPDSSRSLSWQCGPSTEITRRHTTMSI